MHLLYGDYWKGARAQELELTDSNNVVGWSNTWGVSNQNHMVPPLSNTL